MSMVAIASGVGGQPGMRRSTGRMASTGPTSTGRSEDVAAERAVAERGDAARLGHRVVGGEQRLAHAGRDGAGDEQDVGVAGRGDDAEAEALRGRSTGSRASGQLVLAAVARAGVDVADREAAAAARAREGERCGGGGGGREGASASAVGAGVAELEALVDEREVGEQVVGGGVRDDRPVRVGAGAQAEPLDAVAVALDDAASSRRAGSRRGRCRSRAPAPPRLARRRPRPGASSRSSRIVERLPQLEGALLDARLHVAGGALGHDRLEAVVGEPRARARARPRRAPAARAAGPTAPSRRASSRP